MKVVSKKPKEKRRGDCDRVRETAASFPVVHVVRNNDIHNLAIQKIRSDIEGHVLFVKKSMFQHEYPSFKFEGNYFLVFAKEDIREKLEGVSHRDYLQAGATASERVVVEAGVVRSARLASLLGNTIAQGGNAILQEDFVVCEENTVIDEHQAKILKALDRRLGWSLLSVLDVRTSLE